MPISVISKPTSSPESRFLMTQSHHFQSIGFLSGRVIRKTLRCKFFIFLHPRNASKATKKIYQQSIILFWKLVAYNPFNVFFFLSHPSCFIKMIFFIFNKFRKSFINATSLLCKEVLLKGIWSMPMRRKSWKRKQLLQTNVGNHAMPFLSKF